MRLRFRKGSWIFFMVALAGFFSPAVNAQSEVPPTMVMWGQVGEGSTLVLEAPDGAVFSGVLFASYGTPEGSEGSFTEGWCHAEDSDVIVADLIDGTTTAEIPANNGVFGDPCPGTYKQLVVVVALGPSPVDSTLPPETLPPETVPPETLPSTTLPPETLPPQTFPPSTLPPETVPVLTIAPLPPLTLPPLTLPPVTTVVRMPSTTVPTQSVPVTTTTTLPDTTTSTTPEVVPSDTIPAAPPADASDEEKQAFEAEVDVFSGDYDTYVPTGSTVSVATRRVVIAATAVTMILPKGPLPAGPSAPGASGPTGGPGGGGEDSGDKKTRRRRT